MVHDMCFVQVKSSAKPRSCRDLYQIVAITSAIRTFRPNQEDG
jgi:hypothetical protein